MTQPWGTSDAKSSSTSFLLDMKSSNNYLAGGTLQTNKSRNHQIHTDDGFSYSVNTKKQEAYLDKYSGDATEIVIPKSITYRKKAYKVTSLGKDSFSHCSSLTSIEIPTSVKSLRSSCFLGCSSLTSIEIPASVKSLGYYCFYDYKSLMSIEILASVKSLGNWYFAGCSSLTSIKIPASVISLGDWCFAECSSLKELEIPTSVTRLGESCFAKCSSLKKIEIPTSVTSLKVNCFFGCSSLTEIEIPASVENLEENCFSHCSSLKTVIICKMKKMIGYDESLFNGTPIENAILYVQEELLDTYKSTYPWSSFGTILPFPEE